LRADTAEENFVLLDPLEEEVAMAAERSRSGASLSDAQEAYCTPARAISTCWNISTRRCRTVWLAATG
jgi:hypothetical protein